MKGKTWNIIYTVLFMLMLLLPVIFTNWIGGEISEKENRVFAKMPNPSHLLSSPTDFIGQFGNWFSDNMGFRENMINIYKIIDGAFNKVQYTQGTNTYVIGKEDNHFLAIEGSFHLIPKYQGIDYLSDTQMSELSNQLNKIKEYLDTKNIPLAMMIVADKESIYPEYYPESIIRGPEPIQLDLMTNYLKDNTNIDVFNNRQRLTTEKSNYFLYKKNYDVVHYNELGGFFTFLELMEYINVFIPEINTFIIDDINIDYYEMDGDSLPIISLKDDIRFTKEDPVFFDNIDFERPPLWQVAAFKNEDPTLPRILFLCDSHLLFFSEKYLPQNFGQTILIHWTFIEHFEEFIELYKPDIVVLESAEFAMPAFVKSIAKLEKILPSEHVDINASNQKTEQEK